MEPIPLNGLAGGLLIGSAAALLLLVNGRIAGISGIFNGLMSMERANFVWRLAFVLGVVAGATGYFYLSGGYQIRVDYPLFWLMLSGFLVGFGTRLGGGCTSGHGICGLGRLSKRSLAATLMFMLTGSLSYYIVKLLAGV